MADTKKKQAAKSTVTGLTTRQLMNIDQAIDIVAEEKFPMSVGYNLSKIKGQLEHTVKAYNKKVNELREELRIKKDDKWIIPEANQKRWMEETQSILDEVDGELHLRTFAIEEFNLSDSEHYAETQVPQQFLTFMLPLLTD